MKVFGWSLVPPLLLMMISRLFEVNSRGHFHPGVLASLATAWAAIGGIVAFCYLWYCIWRRAWQGPRAMRDIAEELRRARLEREQGAAAAPAPAEPESGRIFGRL